MCPQWRHITGQQTQGKKWCRLSSLSEGRSVPFPCPSAMLLTTEKSAMNQVLGPNRAYIKSETSIRAIYLFTNCRKKIRQFPQGGSCSSQMGTVTRFSRTCAFQARTCLKGPLCALLQLPSSWFATSRGFGGPCWKMEMYVHGAVRGNKAATSAGRAA